MRAGSTERASESATVVLSVPGVTDIPAGTDTTIPTSTIRTGCGIHLRRMTTVKTRVTPRDMSWTSKVRTNRARLTVTGRTIATAEIRTLTRDRLLTSPGTQNSLLPLRPPR